MPRQLALSSAYLGAALRMSECYIVFLLFSLLLHSGVLHAAISLLSTSMSSSTDGT